MSSAAAYYSRRCRLQPSGGPNESGYFTAIDPYCYRKDVRELEDIVHGRQLSSILQGSTLYKAELYNKDIRNAPRRIKKLRKYRWGLGIEHEAHLFHIDPNDTSGEIVMFNSEPFIQRIMNRLYKDTTPESQKLFQFLQKIPYETSGRRCNNTAIIPDVGIKMPEFISGHPFSTIDENFLGVENYISELQVRERLFRDILMKEPEIRGLVRRYGPITTHPVGYSNGIRVPTEIYGDKYRKFQDNLMEDYTGSYHITVTLPHDERKMTNAKFIKMHQNFCNMLQWIEPLLLTAFFTGDPAAVAATGPVLRGSARVGKIGWGNFAGSDVRLFSAGIGRYAKTPTKWREGFKFAGASNLAPCIPASPPAIREGAITSLSSDFRTFGSIDPARPWHRESGAPMAMPNGVEIRIFDQFQIEDLAELVHIIIYIGALSNTHTCKKYVYDNQAWITTMQTIMLKGWLAPIEEDYVRELRQALGLPLATSNRVAYFFFNDIIREIFYKVRDDDWVYLMMRQRNRVKLPEINRIGWEMAAVQYLLRNKSERIKFEKMLHHIIYRWGPDKTMSRGFFEQIVLHYMGANWGNHVDDIAYMLRGIGWIAVERNQFGYIEYLTILKRKVLRSRLKVAFIKKYLFTSGKKKATDVNSPTTSYILAPSYKITGNQPTSF